MRIDAFGREVVDLCKDITNTLKRPGCNLELVYKVNDGSICHRFSVTKEAVPEEGVESIFDVNKNKSMSTAAGSTNVLKLTDCVNSKVAAAVRHTTELCIVEYMLALLKKDAPLWFPQKLCNCISKQNGPRIRHNFGWSFAFIKFVIYTSICSKGRSR